MQYEINGMDYWIEEFDVGFGWNNSKDEQQDDERKFFTTELEALQDAMNWEAGRKERYHGSLEQATDYYNAYINQKIADRKGK